ncbi:unnamed protein product [Cylicocyclus nassatus]|uniref:Uncharacterized protein n=1 Tax=Cylicocyclus nassatus TaxID=53992 RepID=A0AA36H5A6_CYLNA|nr:unnamed protein product [Cylicocyclus nassatus]
MSFFYAKPYWLLIVVLYVLINSSLHRTFRSVTGSFNTSCPTATVSRPQNNTKKPTVKLSIDDICDRRYNYSEWEAVTKTSLAETPDDIRTCLFSPSSSELDGCTLTVCSQRISIADWMYTTEDNNYLCKSEVPFACLNYNAKSPYAIAQYLCSPKPRFVTVIDTEGNPNSMFPEFPKLTRYNYTRIFYVQKVNCAN